MRTRVLALSSWLLAGCMCAAPVETPVVAPSAAPEPAFVAPPMPWAVRFARSCSGWDYSGGVVATDAYVFACSNGAYDPTSGELVDVQREAFELLAASSTRMLFRLNGTGVVVRDADLTIHALELPDVHLVVARGDRVVMAGSSIYEIDLAARRFTTLPQGDACAGAIAIGIAPSGRVECIADRNGSSIRIGLALEGPVENMIARSIDEARWLEDGGIVALTSDSIVWLGEAGEILAERAWTQGEDGRPARILDVSHEGAALISSEGRTELWTRDGETIEIELVVDESAESGAFTGASIVLMTSGHGQLWMYRGPALTLPSAPPPMAPPGLETLEPTRNGGMPSFEGKDGEFVRGTGDVAAFWSNALGLVAVSRSDTTEFARFANDDAEWSRMVAARYVEGGELRWAYRFRDAEGRRVVLGHSYIGGCERTHIDVRIVEHDGFLERWTVQSSLREGVDEILGARPPDAVEIESARRDLYGGDPSIGAL